ncbi:MAG: hypothetical protein LC731_05155, partial [Acidobacteria bacterium]|nr:hypothetical protein [Acidobacteriota bacterium]
MHNSYAAVLRIAATIIFCCCLSSIASAQTAAPSSSASNNTAPQNSSSTSRSSELEEIRGLLLKQQEELKRMRETIGEQARRIEALQQRVEQVSGPGTAAPLITANQVMTSDSVPGAQQTPAANKQQDVEARVGKVEADVKRTSEAISKQLGNIT